MRVLKLSHYHYQPTDTNGSMVIANDQSNRVSALQWRRMSVVALQIPSDAEGDVISKRPHKLWFEYE